MRSGSPYTILFFRDGFFGYGEKGDFRYGSLAHLIPILLMLAAIVLIWRFRERLREWEHEEDLRFAIGALCLFSCIVYYWRLLYVGNEGETIENLMTKLPLEFCEWNACLTAFMIMKRSRRMFGISFLCTVTLGLVPLFTPVAIYATGPSYFKYYQFWLMHLLPFAANFYMLFVHGFELQKNDPLRAEAFCGALIACAVIADLRIPGANYCYLSEKTELPSLANILPSSMAVKVMLYAVVAFTLFCIAYVIFRSIQRKHK